MSHPYSQFVDEYCQLLERARELRPAARGPWENLSRSPGRSDENTGPSPAARQDGLLAQRFKSGLSSSDVPFSGKAAGRSPLAGEEVVG